MVNVSFSFHREAYMNLERIEELSCELADELPDDFGDELMVFMVRLTRRATYARLKRRLQALARPPHQGSLLIDGPQRYATVRLDLPNAPHHGWPAWGPAAD
jgi:hypothetical protein